MTEKIDPEEVLLQRIVDKLKTEKPDEAIVFTNDEAKVLQEWAKFILAWKVLGRFSASARQVILFLAGGLAFLAAFRAGLLDFLGLGGRAP